jgi:hypothetical protein
MTPSWAVATDPLAIVVGQPFGRPQWVKREVAGKTAKAG